jgi:O-antigen/teichoic acid export membrane protein
VTTITKIVTVLAQIVVLLVTKNFLAYLLTQLFVELIQKIFVSRYLNKMYPYLLEKKVEKLTKEETQTVVTKTKALMLHKIGDVARLQTDTIIISSFVNVDTAAIVSNYTYIVTYVGNFVNIIFSSVISGFGNLVATESKEKQYQVFKVYRFFSCWLFGFGAVGFWHLLTPLIGGLWLDEDWALGIPVVTLLAADFYFKGGRSVLENFKIAAGVFEQDRYLPLIQGGINLILSIVLVQNIGVTGVYVGTLVSGILANIIRPVIIYRVCFDRKAWSYFNDAAKYLVVILAVAAVNIPIRLMVMRQTTIVTFALMVIIITVIYNTVFFLVFRRTDEFAYLWEIAARRIPALRKVKIR